MRAARFTLDLTTRQLATRASKLVVKMRSLLGERLTHGEYGHPGLEHSPRSSQKYGNVAHVAPEKLKTLYSDLSWRGKPDMS